MLLSVLTDGIKEKRGRDWPNLKNWMNPKTKTSLNKTK